MAGVVAIGGDGPDERRRQALGRRVRAEREARHLTRDALAARAGTDLANVAAVEDGSRDAALALLWRFCDALGITLAMLFEGLDP